MTWHRPNCEEVVPDGAAWRHAGLRVLRLPAGGSHRWHTGDTEALIVPLAGSALVRIGSAGPADRVIELAGRRDVFSAATDFCYLPPGTDAELSTVEGGRFAVAFTAAPAGLPIRYGPAAGVPVELRGAGICSRQVNNIASADGFACQRLIVVEVLTPAGNWSSYPPHKHDEQRPDETELEEIYYFEVAGDGVGYQRVYASTPSRPIDVLAEVRTGDVVLVPHGWHGPSIASPAHHLYYLNVMAGPGPERAWRFRDDPAFAGFRDTWRGQRIDPRLPFGGGHPHERSARPDARDGSADSTHPPAQNPSPSLDRPPAQDRPAPEGFR